MATNKSQDALDQVWEKYRKSLASLAEALDENADLKAQQTQLTIDFTMPKDIKELEKRIEEKINAATKT